MAHTLTPEAGSDLAPSAGHTLAAEAGSDLAPSAGHTLAAEGGASLSPSAGHTLAAEGGASLGPAAGFAIVPEASVPHTLVVTGITTPADSEEIVLHRVTDFLNGYPTWNLGSDWAVDWTAGSWRVLDQAGTYLATKVSTAETPVDLTGWTVSTGAGQPVIASRPAAPAQITAESVY